MKYSTGPGLFEHPVCIHNVYTCLYVYIMFCVGMCLCNLEYENMKKFNLKWRNLNKKYKSVLGISCPFQADI